MNEFKQEYRRKLPHIQPEQAVFFVTFNLRGAIPKHIVVYLHENYSSVMKDSMASNGDRKEAYNKYVEETNDMLDKAFYGDIWLKDARVAKIVAESFHFLDGTDFTLICYCIMSNHVHFVACNLKKPLYKIMNSIKAHTARLCNKELNRSGSFWQREYFDRIIRDRNDLANYIQYTINNPVNAGLVNRWQDWEFTYCKSEYVEM